MSMSLYFENAFDFEKKEYGTEIGGTAGSSVGRAMDCSSIGHWFNSGSADLHSYFIKLIHNYLDKIVLFTLLI